MEVSDNTAHTSLCNGPENGVAPRSGSIIDAHCVWVSQHASGWQEGEQGVIGAIFDRIERHIPSENLWAVEFGAGDNTTLPLTLAPFTKRPEWKALLIEPNTGLFKRLRRDFKDNQAVVIENRSVEMSGDNTIDAIMARAGIPRPAVMVVDIDSIDYYIVQGMESLPLVLCVEVFDRQSPKHADTPYVPAPEVCGTWIDDDFGNTEQANGAAFDELLGPRGYSLVYRTRFNNIYVHADILPHLRKRCLNLGSGVGKDFPGYDSIDVRVNGKDIRKLDDVADGTVDEVYCSHGLEHLDCIEGQLAVHEWGRVLKPGGTLRIAVPDIAKIGQELGSTTKDPMYLFAMLYGSQTYPENYHRWGYTETTLRGIMNKAGLGFVRPFKPFMQDCSTNPMSLNLEGTKRWWPKVENPRIAFVMSQPELAHTCHEMSIMETVKALTKDGVDIKIVPPRGAFWDRDMTLGTVGALETHDPHFLAYFDYDGQWEADDMRTLLQTINNDPTMAAIGSVQMSRHNDKPLVMDPALDYTTDVTRVQFQHFGLTLVRAEVFDELPHPWWWSVPGNDEMSGRIDWRAPNRSDADITFWRGLDVLGFKVYQHNKVCIGHSIRAIKYPIDQARGVQIVPIENYRRFGKPKTVAFNAERYREKAVPNASGQVGKQEVGVKEHQNGDGRGAQAEAGGGDRTRGETPGAGGKEVI